MDSHNDLELQVAVAKVSKYAVSESGDTVETIERPHGGLSLVLVDGQRSGQVSATLDIVSVDLATRTIVVSRNSHCPVIVVTGPNDSLSLLDEPSEAIGIHARTRPVIAELPITLDTHVIVFTDGLMTAGERHGQPLDLTAFVRDHLQAHEPATSAQTLPSFQAEPGKK